MDINKLLAVDQSTTNQLYDISYLYILHILFEGVYKKEGHILLQEIWSLDFCLCYPNILITDREVEVLRNTIIIS